MQVNIRKMSPLGIAVILLAVTGISSAEGIEAVTRPSADLTLSFVLAGKVSKVLVKEGDIVKAGSPLIQLDDEAERIEVSMLKDQAENTIQIDASAASWDQKKIKYEKTKELQSRGAAGPLELDEAKVDARIAELSLSLAKFRAEQDHGKYEEARVHVDRMLLRSPVDGRFEQLFVKEGEAVEALGKAARVVKIDPLWIDVPVPLSQARSLSKGMKGSVAFPGRETPVEGTVIYTASVADSASETLVVRLELPNPQGWAAGERVLVSFPMPAAAGASEQATSAPSAGPSPEK
jgi:RND family efflux transporter MFP subunit